MHDTQDIVEVHIATFYWDDQRNVCHDEIKKIDDIDAFLRDFNELNCYKWQGDPRGLSKENEGNYIIKFLYSNGDYELIDWHGIAKYTTSDDRLRNYRGYRRFDEAQFKNFVQGYLE